MMSKCFKDFYHSIEPRSESEAETAFDVAQYAIHQIGDVAIGGLTYRQRAILLAEIAENTPAQSRSRQFAIEQAALFTEDTETANASAILKRRLNIIDKARSRIKAGETVY